LYRGQKLDCDCVQIFTRSARQWRGKPLTDEDVVDFRRARRETGIRQVIAHANYLINLASHDRSKHRRSLTAIADDLTRCEVLKLSGLVVHPGSHLGRGVDAGIARIADSINRVLDRASDGRTRILLETGSGEGNGVGSRFEQLAAIIERVERPKRIGVCLDTCHVFAAGYDLRTCEGCDAMWREFRSTVGMSRLKVIHMNDCRGSLGQHLDRHEHLGRGRIGPDAFRMIMQDTRLTRVPKIVETPKGEEDDGKLDRRNLSLLRRWAAES